MTLLASNKLSPTQKHFIVLGLLQLLAAMITPFFWQEAEVVRAVVSCHLIGLFQALLYFTFALMWPYFSFTYIMRVLAVASINISLVANWLGTFLAAFYGTGKMEYIVPAQLAEFPKHLQAPILNKFTLIFINASEYIILSSALLLVGLLVRKTYKYHVVFDILFLILTFVMTVFIIIQAYFPALSNSF